MISNTITVLLCIGQTIILYKLYKKTVTSTKEKTTTNKYLIFIIIACSLILSEISILRYLFPSDFDTKNVIGSLGFFLTSTIFYPIAEELIARGMLLDCLTKKYSFAISNMIQAIIFSIMHLNIQMAIFPLIFGLVLGVVKKYIGIQGTIIIHMLYNLTVYILGSQILKLPNISRYVYLVIGACFAVVMIYTLINLKRLENGKNAMKINDKSA